MYDLSFICGKMNYEEREDARLGLLMTILRSRRIDRLGEIV